MFSHNIKLDNKFLFANHMGFLKKIIIKKTMVKLWIKKYWQLLL